jgi:hypothetical protein
MMAELDLLYHSYHSLIIESDSDALSGTADLKERVLLSSNYSSFSTTSVTSPDITFNSTTGRITFAADGAYLVTFNLVYVVSATTFTTIRYRINGSDVFYTAGIQNFATLDPYSTNTHALLEVKAGDFLDIVVSTDGTETITVKSGTALSLLKANGDYGNIRYTANASASPASANNAIGDEDLGGTVETKLKNVSFNSSTGLLTPSNSRPFLALETLVAENANNTTQMGLSIFANGSSIDNTSVLMRGSQDPSEDSFGLLKSLTGGQTVSGRFVSNGAAITAKNGTSFTAFDVTNNDGNGTPSAFVSLSTDGNSDGISGNTICFDENEYTSYSVVNHSSATGITYTSNGGTFVVANAGKYFVLWHYVINQTASGTQTYNPQVKINNSSVYEYNISLNASFDPIETTLCAIIDAAAGDSFTFVSKGAPAGNIASGTTITMFKVDDLKDLLVESVPTDPLIGNDFTINSFSADGLSPQHNKLDVEQVPFILGVPGAISLRGRRFGTINEPPIVKPGDKKN